MFLLSTYVLCREIIDVLRGGDLPQPRQTSSTKVTVPDCFARKPERLLDDSSISLKNHCSRFDLQMGEMLAKFQQFSDNWNSRLNDLMLQAQETVAESNALVTELFTFKKYV